MGNRYNRDTFTITTDVEVSMDDVVDNIDFKDLVDAYQMDAQELCEVCDFEDVVRYVKGHSDFQLKDMLPQDDADDEIVQLLLSDDGLRKGVLAQLDELSKKPEADIQFARHESGLFSTAKVAGQVRAVMLEEAATVRIRFLALEDSAEVRHVLHDYVAPDMALATQLVRMLLNAEVAS